MSVSPYSSLFHLLSPMLPLKFIFHSYASLLLGAELWEGPSCRHRGRAGVRSGQRRGEDEQARAKAWLLQPGLETELSIPCTARGGESLSQDGTPCAQDGTPIVVLWVTTNWSVPHMRFFFPVTVAQGTVLRWQRSLLVPLPRVPAAEMSIPCPLPSVCETTMT